MESGIEALNKIKETRDRFLAMQKLSKKIFNETIAKINELKQYREEIVSNNLLLQAKRCTLSELEAQNHLLDKRITILKTILEEKEQCVVEQDELLKKDQEDILSARSLYSDRVYEYINEIQSKPWPSTCDEENYSEELDDFNKKGQSSENELRVLNEHISEKESALKEIQSERDIYQEEELKYQQLLEDRKETLKNLIQQVKLEKFNQRKYELNHTIENLYQRNSDNNFLSNNNNPQGETSNYFPSSTSANNWKQSDTLNKIKNLRAVKSKTNLKSAVPKENQTSLLNEEFSQDTVKRSKISEEMQTSSNRFSSNSTISSVEDSCRMKTVQDITENTRKKFTPKKPIFLQKLT